MNRAEPTNHNSNTIEILCLRAEVKSLADRLEARDFSAAGSLRKTKLRLEYFEAREGFRRKIVHGTAKARQEAQDAFVAIRNKVRRLGLTGCPPGLI